MSESADILLRRIEASDTVTADNRLRAESYQRMAQELKEVKVRAASDDGVVTVVAGPDGAVKAITFTDRVRDTAPAALPATALHTIAKARANAARTQAEVVRGTQHHHRTAPRHHHRTAPRHHHRTAPRHHHRTAPRPGVPRCRIRRLLPPPGHPQPAAVHLGAHASTTVRTGRQEGVQPAERDQPRHRMGLPDVR
jgi:DNA-binding protein YbaB